MTVVIYIFNMCQLLDKDQKDRRLGNRRITCGVRTQIEQKCTRNCRIVQVNSIKKNSNCKIRTITNKIKIQKSLEVLGFIRIFATYLR